MRAVADRYVVMPNELQRGDGTSRVVKAIDQQTAAVVAVKLIPRAGTSGWPVDGGRRPNFGAPVVCGWREWP
jgi:hypothetical protein